MLIKLFTGISYLLSSFIFEKYLLYLLLFGYPEREELKGNLGLEMKTNSDWRLQHRTYLHMNNVNIGIYNIE